jgi:ABC-type Fe3+ transport system substrate-binding protein
MSSRLQFVALIVVFGVLIGVPLAWRAPEDDAPGGEVQLVIITPHNEQIRREIGRAFSRWHEAHHGAAVRIDWRNLGGSTDVYRILHAQYEALAQRGEEDTGAGYDVVFGGGDYLFDRKLKPGVDVVDDSGQRRSVSITAPIRLDEALVHEAFPDPYIADRRLYDADGHWWGAVLSSFGIVFNRDVLRARNLPEPRTWSDLTDPRYFGWIALADPSHSGTLRATYEAIVQRYGWEKGWGTIRRASANARYFAADASRVPVDVSLGEVAVGMCVDFYARSQAGSVGPQRLGYVAPVHATIVNPDPVAVLRGAPNHEVAVRFVTFLLTPEGQAVWCFRRGDPMGPVEDELRRSPSRRDMYARFGDRMVDPVSPFEVASPLPEGTPSYFDVVPTVLHALMIDVHDELRAAWSAILCEDDPDARSRMEVAFDALPFTPEELARCRSRWRADPDAARADRLAWTRFAIDQYRRVRAAGSPQVGRRVARGSAARRLLRVPPRCERCLCRVTEPAGTRSRRTAAVTSSETSAGRGRS